MIGLGSLLRGGDDSAQRVSQPEPTGRRTEDPYRPEKAHAKLIAQTRAGAEADAVRHAESILTRTFPVVAEAQTTARARLAALRVAYSERRRGVQERIHGCMARIASAERRVEATERALASAGVPEDQVALAPLRDPKAVVRPLVALAAGALIGAASTVELHVPALIAAVLAAAIAGATWALLPTAEVEPADIASMRRIRAADAKELEDLQADLERERREAVGLDEETFAVAESEVSFAEHLAAVYASAAFGALPAGALAGDREMRSQPPVDVALPAWVKELEASR